MKKVLARGFPARIVAAALTGASAWGQSTALVSVDPSGAQADFGGSFPSTSSDARHVAFQSIATNLVPGDTNGAVDVFVRDRDGGTTTRASLDSSGGQANGSSTSPSVSADGSHVAFESLATNLVPGDANARVDIFVRDLQSGTTARASVDSQGAEGNGHSFRPSTSTDGRYVAFESQASNLVPGDTNLMPDVFVRDLQSGTTMLVSVGLSGRPADNESFEPSISGDGRYVAFFSQASNLVPGSISGILHVYVRDLQAGTTLCASVGPSGAQADSHSFRPSLSSDGRYVAFDSLASDLVPGDANGVLDVFVRDLQTGVNARASDDSFGAPGDAHSYSASVSADGRYVAFHSEATNLVPVDTNDAVDVFLRDLGEGVTTRVSVATRGQQGNDSSFDPSLSADGRVVAFWSDATTLVLGDTNFSPDAFVRDWQQPPVAAFCFGDGTMASPCPCGNTGQAGHGCDNSAGTGGARLSARGTRRLSEDTFELTSTGKLPNALTIFIQCDTTVLPVVFGDGLRCIAGTLKRLYAKNASGGVVSAPEAGEGSISARSRALGDPIQAGETRFYQTYYRDPDLAFCPDPPGNTWNVSGAVEASWAY